MKSISIKTEKGYNISVTEFSPNTEISSVVIIASATGVRKKLYYKFSEYLKHNKHLVYTFDYGGIGDSKPTSLKNFETSASLWATNDLEAVIQYVKEKNGNKDLIIIGHSIGGQLIGLAPSSILAKGIILVAAQTGYWKYWKGINKLKMFLTWYVLIPSLTFLFGYFPGKKIGASEDLPRGVALEWRKWCCSTQYLFDHIPWALSNYKSIKCPIKSYSIEDDNYAPKITVDWLSKKYENASLDRKHITPEELKVKKIGHFGSFSSKNQDSIWRIFLNDIIELTK